MLPRTQAHEATAQEELNFLEPYLQLQALRYPFDLSILVQKAGQLISVSLPVFSLLSFVENVFKHGDLKAPVVIRVEERGGNLQVEVRNRVGKASSKDSAGGVGLENIRTRLHLLCGARAELQVSQAEEVFAVHLTIAPAQKPIARPSAVQRFVKQAFSRPHAAVQENLQP